MIFFSQCCYFPPLSSMQCQLDISYHAGRLQEILADTSHTTLSGRYSVNWICWEDSLSLCQSQIPLKESWGNSFSVKLQVYPALPLIAISVCDGVGWVCGILTSALFLQSPVWLLRGLGQEVCLQCKLKWSGKLSLSSQKECWDMRYVMTLCKIIIFSLSKNIIELFPVACLSVQTILSLPLKWPFLPF